MRRHLGVETQRQWADRAIRRTTPALLGLFSLVTRFAHQRLSGSTDRVRQAAWYTKGHPTFSDALALLRRELWTSGVSCTSTRQADMVKVPRSLIDRLTETLCHAA